MYFVVLRQARWWCPMCGLDHAWGGAMMFFMMFFWVLLIAAIVWMIFRATSGRWDRGSAPPPEGAEEILEARYARGEIDQESFLRMRDDLRNPRGGA